MSGSAGRARLKLAVQHAIGLAHRVLLHRRLPTHLRICFHAIEPPLYEPLRHLARVLRDRGYRLVTMSDLWRRRGAADERLASLSFDDNYRSWYTALGHLSAMGLPATFFVNTGPLDPEANRAAIEAYYDRIGHAGERVPLSRRELQALCDAGHEIGAHGHDHLCLSQVPLARAQQDIALNRAQLEPLIGGPVRHLAVPFGMRRHFTPALEAWCADHGFESVSYAMPGMLHHPIEGGVVHRSGYNSGRSVAGNLWDLGIDGRRFVALTWRSPIG